MLVTLDLVRQRNLDAVAELPRIVRDRRELARTGQTRFGRALGLAHLVEIPVPVPATGVGGLFSVWPDAEAERRFRRAGRAPARWQQQATEHLTLRLEPCQSHGSWLGRDPFAEGCVGKAAPDEPVVVMTYARLRPKGVVPFWRQNAKAVQRLREQPGLVFDVAFADHPLVVGTFSLWAQQRDVARYAYAPGHHQDAVKRLRAESWSTESCFARFRVLESEGTWRGAALPAARTTEGPRVAGPREQSA